MVECGRAGNDRNERYPTFPTIARTARGEAEQQAIFAGFGRAGFAWRGD